MIREIIFDFAIELLGHPATGPNGFYAIVEISVLFVFLVFMLMLLLLPFMVVKGLLK